MSFLSCLDHNIKNIYMLTEIHRALPIAEKLLAVDGFRARENQFPSEMLLLVDCLCSMDNPKPMHILEAMTGCYMLRKKMVGGQGRI